MSPIAVIPARGGSKRIPDKNIALIGGKPLIAWVISAAKKVPYLNSSIYVSTDCEKIASVAHSYGAEVIYRDHSLCGDNVWTEPVVRNVVEEVELGKNMRYSHVFWFNACVPQLTSVDIQRAYKMLIRHELREVIAVREDGISTSAVRVLIRDALEQKCLSAKFGVLTLPYVDVNTPKDLIKVQRCMPV